ncbi:uncharacterized protein BCR38DRAFT_456129 [Pseudomassariella vexata]|uniref:Annexin ANXC4 n=1 Tax=Pseudomassariella vexata TaxID=1141098 RepID=A0A1Y2E7M6_9PEZI|nr:uncharacterized protein BCR38DRAFT_456129 [Pseudomassariella vexata]ORY67324.1 hypothetical protein BCR38DRAFT_456129 [Pseudomassariella vexata]
MSLQVDDRGRRGRSCSPGRRDEDRDPITINAIRMPSPPTGFSYDDDRDFNQRRPASKYKDPRGSSYSVGSPTSPSHAGDPYGRRNRVEDEYYQSRRNDEKHNEDKDWDSDKDRLSSALSGAAAFLPAKYSQKLEKVINRDAESEREKKEKKERKKEKLEEDLAYGKSKYAPRPESPPATYAYAQPEPWKYGQVDDKHSITITNLDHGSRQVSPVGDRYSHQGKKSRRSSYGAEPRPSANVLTVEPSSSRRDRSRSRSPMPPTQRMSSLSVSTGLAAGSAMSLANAPGSPLLESYRGTYQSMSPMPSPLLMASKGPGAFPNEPLSPGISDDERGDKKKRRARFYDPEDDAARLAKALKGEKRMPETEPLIEILPSLTHDQVMELRAEYKRLVKTGSERKGVNVAKHIRARLKDADPLLMKACYSVALGKWESEAYWANFWYQGDKTRRELLIESIMGRTNAEIRRIKDGFSDKKYRDSLTQCMKTELKEDKFKKAVLMVLEERRMEELDEYGRPLPIDRRLVEDDAEHLYRAVKSDKGGESAMIQIVVIRSDSHLRDVMKLYERTYRSNFARDALKKSGNLVGELLAHILNGVINKPVRDALLLHHALTASKKDGLRRELLISRLVRYHWDRHHMSAIKRAYRDRYGLDLSDAVKEGTSGEWGLFCRELCVSRMPDDVKRFSNVEIINR